MVYGGLNKIILYSFFAETFDRIVLWASGSFLQFCLSLFRIFTCVQYTLIYKSNKPFLREKSIRHFENRKNLARRRFRGPPFRKSKDKHVWHKIKGLYGNPMSNNVRKIRGPEKIQSLNERVLTKDARNRVFNFPRICLLICRVESLLEHL